jgi:hypothetical protein
VVNSLLEVSEKFETQRYGLFKILARREVLRSEEKR